MPENQKQRARRLFMALADLAVSERPAALERACGADAALRAEVEALLRADAAAGDFMASPTSRRTGRGATRRRTGSRRTSSGTWTTSR